MADFDATRLIMERSDESRGDYWKDRAVRAETELESLAASVMNLSHPNCQMLLRERNEARAERDALLAVIREFLGWEDAAISAAIDAAREKDEQA